ncbi:MAG TPA: hypothetical protein VFE15_06540 [Marmoricola sp.]|nr:hypothetical protein [Marmoricola sp.]
MLTRREAKAAVAAVSGLSPAAYRARPAGGSAWYVTERREWRPLAPVDDCVWAVLASGRVVRAIPPGDPVYPPTDVAALDDERGPELESGPEICH